MRHASALELIELSTPTRNPPSGAYLLYMKSDGQLYRKSSGGTESLAVAAVGGVPSTRTIATGSGLQGGGDLSADRTLSVVFGTVAGSVAQGNDARLSDTRTPTDLSVTFAKFAAAAIAASGESSSVKIVRADDKRLGLTHHARRGNEAGTSIPNNSITRVPFATAGDLDGITYDATNMRFVVPTAGRYFLKGSFAIAANATGVRQARVHVNGATVLVESVPGSAQGPTVSASLVMKLAANDYVEFWTYQNSGGALLLSTAAGVNVGVVSYVGPTV